MRHFLLLVLGVFSCRVAFCGDPIAAGTPRAGIGGQEQAASQTANAETAVETTRAKTDDQPSAPTSVKADYSKEPVVIEQLHVQYRFEGDGTGSKRQFVRARVQSEGALQQWGQLRFGYNSASEHCEIRSVRVVKPDGSVVTAGADAVQELNEPIQRNAPVYTDYREKHVTVPGLRPGDVLEYELVTSIHTALAPGQFWMQYDFQKNAIVLDEQLEIDLPSARMVKLKNKPGVEPATSEADGRRTYSGPLPISRERRTPNRTTSPSAGRRKE